MLFVCLLLVGVSNSISFFPSQDLFIDREKLVLALVVNKSLSPFIVCIGFCSKWRKDICSSEQVQLCHLCSFPLPHPFNFFVCLFVFVFLFFVRVFLSYTVTGS